MTFCTLLIYTIRECSV